MCGCSGNSGSNNRTGNYGVTGGSTSVITSINENCDITREILENWQRILLCIKGLNKESDAGLSLVKLNSLLGTIQSALNYPDNYCYYENKLSIIPNEIIIKILNDVPECI